MNELPSREDILDYAEGTPRSPELEKKVLQLLASNPELRSGLAELKKDLYLIGQQIPEYESDEMLGRDVRALAESWLKLSLSRRFLYARFLNAKEFFAVVSILVLGTLLVAFLLLVRGI